MGLESTEKLYRAVPCPERRPNWWRSDGTISSAAFKCSKGVSVDRSANRQDEDIFSALINNQQMEYIFCVIYKDVCSEPICAYVEEDPIDGNPYHCNIWRDFGKNELTGGQARALAKSARLAYPNTEYPIVLTSSAQ